jgi:fibronectin-binding autotransporter adhesin
MKNHFFAVRSLARSRAMLILKAASVLALIIALPPVAAAADLVWVGNDGFNSSVFSNSGNWQGNTLPSWGYTNSLTFSQNQNSNVTGLNYNWGDWRQVNDISWDSSFPVARTLSASNGGGINFKTRIENNSSLTQTVAMELSGGSDGASDIQLNPVNGSLIFSGTLWNDNSKDYVVYGTFFSSTTLTLNTTLGTNATQANVDFTVASGRNSAVQVNASQVWAGTTDVQSGSFTTANGVTLASTAIIVGGGTVATTSANTLADTASLTVNTGRLSIGGSDTVASLAGSGGTIDIASVATLTAGNASSTSYAGSITGSGNLTKVGSGTFTLSAASSYTGTTTVSAGRLSLAAANLLSDSSAVTGTAGAVFALGGNETIGSLAGSLDVALGSSTLTAGGNGQSTTYSGGISGSGGFSKVGGGTLQLAGPNTYAGLTSVIDGGLRLNGSIAGGLNIAPIATLSGTGTVGGNATITGTHSPGNSPGAQTFNGNLTYQAGAVVNWELIANTTGTAGVNYDQIVVPTGNLTFSGSTTLALSFNSVGSAVNWSDSFWDVNRSWMVYDLSGGTTTGLSNLSLGGSLLDSQSQPLSPTSRGYFTTSLSGQDVVLSFTAVPEPSTWAMALVGLSAGLVIRRHHQRRHETRPEEASRPH